MAAYNEEVAKGSDLPQMIAGWAKVSVPDSYLYSLTDRQGACGTIELPSQPAGFERVAKAAGATYADWHSKMKVAVEKTTERIRPVAIEVAKAASTRDPLPAPRDLASDLLFWRPLQQAATASLVGSIDKSAQSEAKNTLQPTGTTIDVDTQLAGNMRAGGWTQAGFYYQLISHFSADASAIQRMMPLTTPGDAIGATSNPNGGTFQAVRSQVSTWWFGDKDGDTREMLSEVTNTYNIAVNWWNESVARSNLKAFTNERQVFADASGEMSNYLVSPGALFDAFRFLNPAFDSQNDPMIPS